MPRLTLCTLCDDVRFEVGNKHTLVGLFDTFNVADFARPLPPFRIFARIGLEQAGIHPLVVRLASAEGNFRVEMAGQLDARAPNEVSGLFEAVFTVGLNTLRLPRAGRYEVQFVVGGQEIGGCAFLARSSTPPTLQ